MDAKPLHLTVKNFTALIIAGCCLSSLQATELAPWSFRSLLNLSETTHPSVLARQRAESGAQASLEAAEWQRFPTPGIEVGSNNSGQRQQLVYLKQPLWAGGAITAGIDAAESRLNAARKHTHVARRDVVQRLIDAYADVLRRQSQQEIHHQHVQQLERLLKMMERRVAAEVSARVDLDLARSRLFQAANDLSHVSQSLTAGKTRLAELAGQTVQRVSADTDLNAKLPPDLAEAIHLASSASPMLGRLQQEQFAASADIRVERAAYWPQVNLRLERGDNNNSGVTQSDQRAMIVMQSQLGAGLSTGAKVDAAIARHDALVEEYRLAKRELETEVADAWHQFIAARQRFENSEINRASAGSVFESYTRQYVVGQKSWLDVLNAVREANNAAVAVEDAQADWLKANLKLQLLTGTL
jgi:adhesin transport system outer membrane protein